MRDFGVVLFIVAAGFVAWLAVTDRLGRVSDAWNMIVGSTPDVGVPMNNTIVLRQLVPA